MDMSGTKIKLHQTDIQQIRAVHEMLRQEQWSHLTIQELAQEAGMNRTKLQYGFKQLFGISIYAYQVQVRLGRAKKLLEDSEKPIKQIALLVGYNTINSFSTAFKKTYQLSPAQWRTKHR